MDKTSTRLSLAYLMYTLLLHTKWILDIMVGYKIDFSNITVIMTLGFLSYMFIKFFVSKPRFKYNRLITLFIVIYIYYALLILTNEFYTYSFYGEFDKNSLRKILVSASLIIASGNSLYSSLHLSKTNNIRRMYMVMAILPTICSLFISYPHSTTFFIRSIKSAREIGVSYQAYGDTLLIFYSILLISIRRKSHAIFLFFLTAFGLFTLGSKAAFIGFVSSNCFLYLLYLYRKNLKSFVTALLILSFLCVLAVPVSKIYSEKLPEKYYSWIFNIVAMKTQEQSFYLRKIIEDHNAITQLKRLPLGNYKHEIYEGMGEGTYTHNLLDLIDQMGIGIFIFYVAFLLYNFINSIYFYLKKNNDLMSGNIILLTYWLILFAFSRSSGTLFLMYVLYLSIFNLNYFKSKNIYHPKVKLLGTQRKIF